MAIRYIIAILFLMLSANVMADRLVINLASKHFGADKELNEFNPGLGYEWQFNHNTWKMTAGAGGYQNSYDNLSVYGTFGIEKGKLGLLAGLASGYEHTDTGILPIMAGYFQQNFAPNVGFRILAAPGPGIVGIDKSSDAVFALQLLIENH